MSKLLGTYDPKEVSITFGALRISGFADGSFITVAKLDKDIYKEKVGAYGEVGRTKNNNTAGTITFKLKQTSPSNAALDLLKFQPAAQPVQVKNNSDSKYLAVSAESWIKTDPDDELGMEESDREWVIFAADLLKSHIS